VVYRELHWADLGEMLIRTARITGVVFLIIASASVLSWWMTFERIPQLITTSFLAISHEPQTIIALVVALLLVLGTLMDINAILIILSPVLHPLLTNVGMDPVHAGIMIVLALNIGLMTPPVGASLFVLCSISGEKLEAVTKAMWPFMLAEILILLLVAFWPQMTLFVPRLLGL
jgi:tripartite ATP-independent transporter DctM subunit